MNNYIIINGDIYTVTDKQLKHINDLDKKVIDAYNNASIRGLKPVGKVGGKYNASDDVVISIDNYIKWISENHSEKKEAPSESKKSLVKTKSNITGKSTKTTETPANSTTNSTNKNRRGQE